MIDSVRHKAIFNPETFHHPVHIIGCGGMGSRMAEGLTRMGVGVRQQSPIHLYDFDVFECHNIANQWIDIGNIGGNKAVEIGRNVRSLDISCDVRCYLEEVSEHIPLSGVVCICVDSMQARRAIMERVVEENKEVICVIETRMDAETAISHCFNPHNIKQSDCWWLYWHSDKEADHIGGCSEPQSIISAIYATTALALKQFEQFARVGDTDDIANRVYFDLRTLTCTQEYWPST